MKNSIVGDDNLSQEIMLFKLKREQANMIEQIFRNIKSSYNGTDLNQMKNEIDRKLSTANPAYNTVAASVYFNKLKNELSGRSLQSPEFTNGSLINDFKVDEIRRGAIVNQPVAAAPVVRQIAGPGMPSVNQVVSSPTSLSPPPIRVNQQPSSIVTGGYPSQNVVISNPPITRVIDPASQPQVVQTQVQTAPLSGGVPSRGERNYVSSPNPQEPVSVGSSPLQNGRPSASAGQPSRVVMGKQPLAMVSPDKTEVQVNNRIDNPRLTHIKNINLSHIDSIPSIIRAIDDRNAVVGYEDGMIRVIDIQNVEVAKQYKITDKKGIKAIERIDNDGKARYDIGLLVGVDNTIILLDIMKSTNILQKFIGEAGEEVLNIIDMDKGKFVSSTKEGSIYLWNVNSQRPIQRIKDSMVVNGNKLTSMIALDNSTKLVTGDREGNIQVYDIDLNSNAIVNRNYMRDNHSINQLNSFYGNSKYVFTCLKNNIIHIWNVESGECLNEIGTNHQAHDTLVDVLKVTSVSDVPDIALLGMLRNEDAMCIGGVDDKTLRRLESNKPVYINYNKQPGGHIVQIYDSNNTTGTNFMLLENDKTTNGYLLSL